MALNAGTISAIAALLVTLMALLIAFAQVAQQYAATVDLMRKCDSIVEILDSSEDQISRSADNPEEAALDNLAKLQIRGYLWLVGLQRLQSAVPISFRTTLAWAGMMVEKFEDKIQELDRTCSAGGVQELWRVTDDFMHILT